MKHRGKVVTWLIISITVVGLLHVPTFAAVQPIEGLAMSPPRTEFDVKPGGTKNLIVNVANFTKSQADVQLSSEEFNVTGENYDYQFSVDTDVSKWASFVLNKLSLAANQNVDVPVTVTVPQTAEPGGYYIGLFASTNVQASAEDVQAQQNVVSLLYITVDGNVTRTGSLKSLTSPFYFDVTQTWKMEITNSGTVHFRSDYSATVEDVFRSGKVASASSSALILPHTTRAISTQIPAPKHIGLYKIIYTVGLGDKPSVTKSYYLLFLPTQDYLPLLSLVIIVVVALGYLALKLATRKKN